MNRTSTYDYKNPQGYEIDFDLLQDFERHLNASSPESNPIPCRDWVVGDISRQHAMEIWRGKDFSEFRQTLVANGMLPICTRCCLIARR